MELFTSFEGRISRKSFWLGLIGITIIGLVLSMGLLPIIGSGGVIVGVVQFILTAGIFYLWAAVVVKRLHDRNKAAVPWAVIFMAPGAVLAVMNILRIDYHMMDVAGTSILVPGAIAMTVTWISTLFSLWMIVELGFLKGTPGQNKYGMNPLAGPDGLPEGSRI